MNHPFQFKKFIIHQDRCAMKIGTDAVLLGAWTSINAHQQAVLDIGAGTGILALMMAQRSNATLIDAIEIDDDAYEQCVDNFEASPWNDRLFCYHASLEQFTDEMEDTYDLIISNPPFLPGTYKSTNKQRDLARFIDAMPFAHLIESVSKLLSPTGQFSVIIPFSEEDNFMALALNVNLFPNKILRVKGRLQSEVKRSLIQFSFQKTTVHPEQLIIETARHQYTDEYIALTKDFYLNL